jgi:hypothetical protein
LDLNECAKNGIRAWELTNDHDPVAVVVQTGLGDGRYTVEARYEDSMFGERCAEIRIKFLPHPQFDMDVLAATEAN